MGTTRLNSLDPVDMPGWRWSSFLENAIQALAPFEPELYDIQPDFLQKEGVAGSRSNPLNVQTMTWACKTNKLRQVRACCVEAGNFASVCNFVISPFHTYELPFFGADLVTLPSGHLLALDLQPVLKSDQFHTGFVWEKLIPLFEKWQVRLPDGGPIPEEARTYFSPGFLWTRLPLGKQADNLIEDVIMPAFLEYFELYLTLVRNANPVISSRALLLLEGQKKYMAYRAEKDPARGMLTSFYGKKWTESYIKRVLFNL